MGWAFFREWVLYPETMVSEFNGLKVKSRPVGESHSEIISYKYIVFTPIWLVQMGGAEYKHIVFTPIWLVQMGGAEYKYIVFTPIWLVQMGGAEYKYIVFTPIWLVQMGSS